MRGVIAGVAAFLVAGLLVVPRQRAQVAYVSRRAKKTAIVIKGSFHLKLDLLALYMQNTRADRYDLWYLFDTSNGWDVEGPVTEAFETFASAFANPAKLFVYDHHLVRATYPHTDFHALLDPLKKKGTDLGWAVTAPCINAWRRATNVDYDFFWVLEDDVRLGGDKYGAFFDRYYDVTQWDLITTHVSSNSVYYGNWNLPKEISHKARVNVQRYSMPFLLQLHTLVTLGLTMYTEWFAFTVCSNAEDCSVHDLADDGVLGPVYTANSRVTRDQWPAFSKANPGKWFHALKWMGACRDVRRVTQSMDLAFPIDQPPCCVDDGADQGAAPKASDVQQHGAAMPATVQDAKQGEPPHPKTPQPPDVEQHGGAPPKAQDAKQHSGAEGAKTHDGPKTQDGPKTHDVKKGGALPEAP